MSDDEIRAAIANASRYLTDHPDEARYTDSSATAVLESGLRFRAEYPGGSLSTDMPASVGGTGSAPSPGPMRVPDDKLRTVLGITSVAVKQGTQPLAITDSELVKA